MRYAAAWTAYWVAATTNLVGQLLHRPELTTPSQLLLMPLLAAALLSSRARAHPMKRWVLAALVASWLGDLAPQAFPPQWHLLGMMGFFLVAQLCWVGVLARHRDASVAVTHRWLLLVYAAVAGAVLLVALPGEALPVQIGAVAYALTLTTVAVLASGLGRMGLIGGALYLFSDGLIAVDRLAWSEPLPFTGAWIMVSYAVANAMLVSAVLRWLRRTRWHLA